MSDSVRPHRRQPTRLPRPWDSPGKNTGVGCHFLLQRMKVKSEGEVTQSCPTLSDPMDCSLPGASIHGIFQARVLEWGAIALTPRGSHCFQKNIHKSHDLQGPCLSSSHDLFFPVPFTLLHPQRPSFSSDMDMFLPQGLCTCCGPTLHPRLTPFPQKSAWLTPSQFSPLMSVAFPDLLI